MISGLFITYFWAEGISTTLVQMSCIVFHWAHSRERQSRVTGKCWAFRLQQPVTNTVRLTRIHRTQGAWAPNSQMSRKKKPNRLSQTFLIHIILRICNIGHILPWIHPSCHGSVSIFWKAAEPLRVRLFRRCPRTGHLVVFDALDGVVVQLNSDRPTDRGTTKPPSPDNFSVLLEDASDPGAELCPSP